MDNIKNPLFSIIVPLYKGGRYVPGLLKNIQNQGLCQEDYEVILVDDASPDNSVEEITKILKNCPKNVRLLVNEVNRRQGGARNHAVEKAQGEWIVYLDQDDVFTKGALLELKDAVTHAPEDGDIIAVDLINNINGNRSSGTQYIHNDKGWMSGGEYIKTCEVSWVPWAFVYRRKFLVENQIRFVEHVRFEDVDYIMDAFRKAGKARYFPIPLVEHSVWDGQTSAVGNNYELIRDLFRISTRVGMVAAEEYSNRQDVAKAILSHHHFMHKVDIKRYLWRLPYKKQVEILRECPIVTFNDKISYGISLAKNAPRLLALTLTIISPILRTMVVCRHKIRKIK